MHAVLLTHLMRANVLSEKVNRILKRIESAKDDEDSDSMVTGAIDTSPWSNRTVGRATSPTVSHSLFTYHIFT
jgi:hypothetical protein